MSLLLVSANFGRGDISSIVQSEKRCVNVKLGT